jgi:tetratricopeptide (TPR) repeat protein
MLEGNFEEAADRHGGALALFQQLREPSMEAVAWHQLGTVFWKTQQWDEAERHFRESARIKEEAGDLAGATRTWNALAVISQDAGKEQASELWYRKALDATQNTGDQKERALCLSNLASLLSDQPARLAEARQLAEESLAIKRILDPGAAEIWTTYNILAGIADKEAAGCEDAPRRAQLEAEARSHRRLARETRRSFAGTRHELRQLAPLILATVGACAGEPNAREAMEQFQQTLPQAGSDAQALSEVLDRILAGDRDQAALCEGIHPASALIVETILQGIADPSTLTDLLPNDPTAPETPPD